MTSDTTAFKCIPCVQLFVLFYFLQSVLRTTFFLNFSFGIIFIVTLLPFDTHALDLGEMIIPNGSQTGIKYVVRLGGSTSLHIGRLRIR